MADKPSSSFSAGSALSQARSVVGSQLMTSVFTFAMNAWIARRIGPRVFGVANNDLYVLHSSIVYLTQEWCVRSVIAFKIPLQRNSKSKDKWNTSHIEKEIMKLGLWAVIFGGLLSMALRIWAEWVERVTCAQCLTTVAFAGWIQVCATPLLLLASHRTWEAAKASAESLSRTSLTVFSAAALYFDSRMNESDASSSSEESSESRAIWILSLGYLFSSISVCCLWLWLFRSELKRIVIELLIPLMTDIPSLLSIESSLLDNARKFTLQSVFKYSLTEGGKLMNVFLQMPAEVSGIYSLVNNLCSIVTRFLFRPLESVCFVEFAKQRSSEGSRSGNSTSLRILVKIGQCVVFISLVAATFAPSYSHCLLSLIYGDRWLKAADSLALSASLLLLVTSLNGITEAYVQSGVPGFSYNVFLVVTSVLSWILCIIAFHFYAPDLDFNADIDKYHSIGSLMLISVDIVIFLVRIVYNLSEIYENMPDFHLRSLFPSAGMIAFMVVSFALCHFSWMITSNVCFNLANQSESVSVLNIPRYYCEIGHWSVALVILLPSLFALTFKFDMSIIRTVAGLLRGNLNLHSD